MSATVLNCIAQSFHEGNAIPYLGPGVLSLDGIQFPASQDDLVVRLTAKASVPHKVRNNLGAAAQFIENFKHRSTVTQAMTEAFSADARPSSLHRLLMSMPALPLVVHAWYDDLPQKALRLRSSWGMAQGVAQSEHFGTWVHYYNADGSHAGVEFAGRPADWKTLLYQPLGSVWPARNYLVSDSDFVEVITEIDIQTPLPGPVQEIRKNRNFLFLGCRFSKQIDRLFAHQIMKRSSQKHWAILPEEPTRNEARFMEEHSIERIPMTLGEFVSEFPVRHK
ncbi:MAG: SIR2 family NAD-dependent protein deacylase [Acidobacteriaceae bacterium]